MAPEAGHVGTLINFTPFKILLTMSPPAFTGGSTGYGQVSLA
jgi:hypothetical protein